MGARGAAPCEVMEGCWRVPANIVRAHLTVCGRGRVSKPRASSRLPRILAGDGTRELSVFVFFRQNPTCWGSPCTHAASCSLATCPLASSGQCGNDRNITTSQYIYITSHCCTTECVKVLQSKSSKINHGPIIGSDETVPTQSRACDWSMLFVFDFVRNTLTHFVILYHICIYTFDVESNKLPGPAQGGH